MSSHLRNLLWLLEAPNVSYTEVDTRAVDGSYNKTVLLLSSAFVKLSKRDLIYIWFDMKLSYIKNKLESKIHAKPSFLTFWLLLARGLTVWSLEDFPECGEQIFP